MKTNFYKRAEDVVYQLVCILYRNRDYARYPTFSVYQVVRGYYHTLAQAETAMRHVILTEANEDIDVFGYYIHELPLNMPIYGCETQSTRAYLSDGTLLTQTLVSSIDDPNGKLQPFLGREPEQCPFQKGDIVEVLRGNKVTLEIVDSLPVSPARIQELQERSQKKGWGDVSLDYSDDCYLTYDIHHSHSHPSIERVFPAHLPISERLRPLLRVWSPEDLDD